MGNLSGDASKAAAKGDAAGVMGGLKDQNAADKKAQEENGRKAADFTREVMQAVVDAVHELQPGWYKEFLKNKELKKIADDYDATKDFRAFVGALAASEGFDAMLAAKSRLAGMRSLVKSLFSDSKLAKNLDRVFADNIDDANLAKLVKQYGRKCTLPQDMVARASGGDAPQEKPKKKPAAPQRSKPTFKPLNKGGFGGGGFGQQQQPLGGGRPPTSSLKPEDINLDDIKKLQQGSGH